MHYYKVNDTLIQSSTLLALPEISDIDFDVAMQQMHRQIEADMPQAHLSMEERMALLETGQEDLVLAMAEVMGGGAQ